MVKIQAVMHKLKLREAGCLASIPIFNDITLINADVHVGSEKG